MRSGDATLLAGALFIALGMFFFWRFPIDDKWFSLGPNLLSGGAFIVLVSLFMRRG